jgi:signal transduction histidine kinase
MQVTTAQTIRTWYLSLSGLLKRSADSSDFVWLGRFRFLTLYTFLKGLLLLTAGVVYMRLNSFPTRPAFTLTPHFWVLLLLGMTTFTLLLITGLVMASEYRPRSIGLMLIGASDVCIVLAILYAALVSNLALLFILLVFISCSTLFLIERISRYAGRFQQSSSQLEIMKNEVDMLLLQLTQILTQAIERERMSLKREIHDGLLQELCALSLQMSIVIRHKSEDGALQLNATDVVKLEATLRRAVSETRNVMAGMQNTTMALDTIDTLELPILIT